MKSVKEATKSDYEVLCDSQGREYYYNKKTRVSSFAKPDVLKGSDEQFEQNPWIECRSSKGKMFYHNTVTKESRWIKPKNINTLNKTELCGIGTSMKITDAEVSQYLINRLIEQYNISGMKDGLYKLSTESIFRAIDIRNRNEILRKCLTDKEAREMDERHRMQKYYVDEICKMKVEAPDFFGFNNVLSKHPYYIGIENKFACYEEYIQNNEGGVTRSELELIFHNYGVELSTSVIEVLGLNEVQKFDRKDVLLAFIKYFKALQRKFMINIQNVKSEMICNANRWKAPFVSMLEDMYRKGRIHYKMKFKNAFHVFKDSKPFQELLAGDEDIKEIYFKFMNDLEHRLGRYIQGRDREVVPDATDRRAIDMYFQSIQEEKEEGEI
ncbi:Prp40-like splicing factor [Ordospora colligata]|uniref:Prp40-like splicing factor n=1 Tax=Ordospora colligata OC4 TaxID=1354746 RepID=A0A0B2UD82_9MICR|nr:Prp40-like splicing factor [Ordospora colligata OC4]KHN69031.1 Prp40-like splicing factor [Ordospora colligata OC4]TBU14312.1 Prp40-like splicing factor [Ordospora colligata]TBU14377.1 Prp40-like splicing factor [Ordospora colligata]TBU17993.1 Prp40-like splicing factor [Ordospora colligata]